MWSGRRRIEALEMASSLVKLKYHLRDSKIRRKTFQDNSNYFTTKQNYNLDINRRRRLSKPEKHKRALIAATHEGNASDDRCKTATAVSRSNFPPLCAALTLHIDPRPSVQDPPSRSFCKLITFKTSHSIYRF